MTNTQIHKRLPNDQVCMILSRYDNHELKASEARAYLSVSKSRFYEIVDEFKRKGSRFSIAYARNKASRTIDPAIEEHILAELQIEKEKIIENRNVPTNRYNYSYIRNLISDKYGERVALHTIIDRAKDNGYWKAKPPRKIHDREVLTNYIGELIQHDSSRHLFAPDAQQKWYLITSLDDHSRALLYADFWEKESTWAHITAVEELCVKHGFPFEYYADQHSIFRYVKHRDRHSPWMEFEKHTDDIDPQWKQVLKDCGVNVIYALSPQAKGKIERPYQWLQDHLVRSCLREGVTKLEDGRELLRREVQAYNWKRVHSTTGEVPMMRFEQARKEGTSMFRPFRIKSPFELTKDIFCLRMKRTVDSYRRISVKGTSITVPVVPPHEEVELRLSLDLKKGITDIRFWYKNQCVGSQKFKIEDFLIVQF